MTRQPVKKGVESISSSKRVRNLILGVVVFVSILVLVQLLRWQVFEYDRFAALANAQLSAAEEIFTKRGTIYTQDGVVLAVDSPSWDIVISLTNDVDKKFFTQTVADVEAKYAKILASNKDSDKQSVIDANNTLKERELGKTKERVFAKISEIIGEPTETLEKSFNIKAMSYQVIFKGINKRQRDQLDALKLHGIYTNDAVNRLYPNGNLMAHIIGYVGTDSNGEPRGNYGVEGFFWGDIKGKEGITQQEKDLSGKAIISKEYRNIRYREGKNIVLTVNSGIQKKVEKILAEGVQEQKGDSGTVIIMDPKSGNIIAMATYPDYDPNEFWKVKDVGIFSNKAVSGPYEYGSVQKPLTIAMAMTEGKLTENDICNDTGKMTIDNETIYNFSFVKHGKITPMQTLQYSDNICAAEYGLKVGAQAMHGYLIRLGIGSPTGIGIHEEETSFLKAANKWLNIDTATTSYGQAISATPLQLLSALSTLANHGVRMQPKLVEKIYNNEDEIVIPPTSAGQVFPPEIADKVAGMMREAAMSRPEFRKYRNIYSIAGKTGTAQVAKSDASGYYDDRTNVTFVGFAPAEDARFIMLVKVANPKNATLANLTVMPLWLKIFDTIKDDLGVPRIN